MKIIVKKGDCSIEYVEPQEDTNYPKFVSHDKYKGNTKATTKSERLMEVVREMVIQLKVLHDEV